MKTKARKKKPSVSALHRELAKQVVEVAKKGETNKTKADLMQAAGYSGATARSSAARVWSSDGFQAALAEHGLTPAKLSKVFNDAVGANVVTIFKGNATQTDVPDHKIRLQAVSLAGDFLGAKKQVHEVKKINVNISEESMADILGLG